MGGLRSLSKVRRPAESVLHVSNPVRQVLDLLSQSLPQGTADPIRQQLENALNSEKGLTGLPIIGVLWLDAGSGASLLGGVVVLLLWLQTTVYALLLGAELNDLLEHPSTTSARAWDKHHRRSRRTRRTGTRSGSAPVEAVDLTGAAAHNV